MSSGLISDTTWKERNLHYKQAQLYVILFKILNINYWEGVLEYLAFALWNMTVYSRHLSAEYWLTLSVNLSTECWPMDGYLLQ